MARSPEPAPPPALRAWARALLAATDEDPGWLADRVWRGARGDPARFRSRVEALARGVPLAHLEGRVGFHAVELLAGPEALVPRSDSECVLEALLDHLPEEPPGGKPLLDLGTGSGCLLLGFLHLRPAWRGVGADVSAEALALAERNRRRLCLERRASLVRSDWWDGLTGRFAAVVANPPYVEPGEELGPGVAEHEPHGALFTPERDPLWAYRHVLAGARQRLAPSGVVVVQVGAGRAEAVAGLARGFGFRERERRCDLGGVERALVLRRE